MVLIYRLLHYAVLLHTTATYWSYYMPTDFKQTFSLLDVCRSLTQSVAVCWSWKELEVVCLVESGLKADSP